MHDHNTNLDNFVPKFGSLASTRITPVVLVGVWLIFLPVTIGAVAAIGASWINTTDVFASLLASVIPFFVFAIGMAILYRVTLRFCRGASDRA